MMVRTVAAFLSLLSTLWTSHAFSPASVVISTTTKRWSSSSGRLPMASVVQDSSPLRSTAADDDEREAMRKSIEAMRQEARNRLDALSKEMSDYQPPAKKPEPAKSASTLSTTTTTASKNGAVKENDFPVETVSMDSLEGDLTKIPVEDLGNQKAVSVNSEKPPAVSNTRGDEELEELRLAERAKYVDLSSEPVRVPHADVNRLDDTRWKIVFDLGREPGTWMPPQWGASGDRLRFSIVVDLTSETYYGREEFFDGIAGAKVLKILEAKVGPTYWGSDSASSTRGPNSNLHGQEQLAVAPTGAYKVMRGAGPMGTDALRFFIETEQEIVKSVDSDVSCPKGRIYGNCGYFPVYSTLPSSSSKDSGDHHHWKDLLQKEYNAVSTRYEQLQREADDDTRLFSMEQLSRLKEIMDTRGLLKRLEQRILEARQREPDRSQLRLSRPRGDVGLSKEGGVCLKVQKGLAIEYHILGRMEVASVDKQKEERIKPTDHEDYEGLVRKLHP